MVFTNHGERVLLSPLIAWLNKRGRIRADTVFVEELPWFGRRVDVATLTATRRATAYELKLGDNRRAIEQAAYNALSFDRSFVVTATMPTRELIELATDHAVGVIVISSPSAEPVLVLEPLSQPINGSVRQRLLAAIRSHGTELADV